MPETAILVVTGTETIHITIQHGRGREGVKEEKSDREMGRRIEAREMKSLTFKIP